MTNPDPSEMVERVGAAIELASNERCYGLYDYSNYPGDRPPHVVRYERTGASVFRSRDAAEARLVYERLCRCHIAIAAIEALREPTGEMLAEACALECLRSDCLSDGVCRRSDARMSSEREHWQAMLDAALGNPQNETAPPVP